MANSHMTFGVDLLPKTTNTYALGNSNQKWNLFANNIAGLTKINAIITGTGTEAVTSGTKMPALWKFDLGISEPIEGDKITIKIPVAGHANGVFVSLDNGNTYYPVSVSNKTLLTVHYAKDQIITLIFLNEGGTNAIYPASTSINGATYTLGTSTNISGAHWCVLNYYDSGNTNTLQRTFRSATNIELPITGISTANSSTAAYDPDNSIKSNSYASMYGVIPNDTEKLATINPSTGAITAPKFIGALDGNASTADYATTAGSVNLDSVPDLKAIENLTGTSGFLKKTAANTWALDDTSYLPLSAGSNQTLTGNLYFNASDKSRMMIFNYVGYNYILVPNGGHLRVGVGNASSPTGLLEIYQDENEKYVVPSTLASLSGQVLLGTSEYKWKEVHATKLYGEVQWSDVNKTNYSGIEFIMGTWTAASGTWTGVSTDSELYDGKQIILYMPYAGSGNATLNLTLTQKNNDTTTTGPLPVFFENTTRFTIHKGAHSQLHLIYHTSFVGEGPGWWYVANRDTNNNDTSAGYLRDGGGDATGIKTTSTLYPYLLLLPAGDGITYHPINASNKTTANTKTNIYSGNFNITQNIYYYNTNENVAAGTTVRQDRVWQKYPINLGYSFNIGSSLTAGKEVYMVASLINSTTATLRNPSNTGASAAATGTGPITQTLPASNDGYIYIYLGRAYNASSITLALNHPIYWYRNGHIELYNSHAITAEKFQTENASIQYDSNLHILNFIVT